MKWRMAPSRVIYQVLTHRDPQSDIIVFISRQQPATSGNGNGKERKCSQQSATCWLPGCQGPLENKKDTIYHSGIPLSMANRSSSRKGGKELSAKLHDFNQLSSHLHLYNRSLFAPFTSFPFYYPLAPLAHLYSILS